jgi:hypothetical protein
VDGFLSSKGIRFLERLRTFSVAEHALLGPGRSAREEHLGSMDVPLCDGALGVALSCTYACGLPEAASCVSAVCRRSCQGRNGFSMLARASAGRM